MSITSMRRSWATCLVCGETYLIDNPVTPETSICPKAALHPDNPVADVPDTWPVAVAKRDAEITLLRARIRELESQIADGVRK